MSLPGFSVRRPVFATMVTLIVVVLGIMSLTRLRVDLLPDIELPTLSIRTQYEGASPEVMERLITQILEEIVATVPGVEEMNSISSDGNSNVRVTFAWGTDINTASVDVQATLEDEINEFPDDIVRPRVSKFDVNTFPVIILGISSKLDPVELTELIDDQIRYRLARVPGVAQVDTWGEFKREIRIEIDPDKLAALRLPINLVTNAIRNANLDLPTGKIEEGKYEVTLRAPAEFTDLKEIRDTIIFQKDGSAVRIGQVAEVVDTYEKQTRTVRVDGWRGLRAGIRKQSNANTVEVAKGVLAEVDSINRAFPQINVKAVINQGNFIERSIFNVAQSVVYGGGLAVLVLLFFLRNVRSTVVIALAIPISVVGAFALLFFAGFTLNLMTLGGLALGVGMMVDSSIVVLENIYRRRNENHEQPKVASVEGAMEVAPAIIASTLTTLVIFLPLAFTRGITGVLFKELAYVIIFSLACSLIVSLSLVPMLASNLLASGGGVGAGRTGWIQSLAASAATIFHRLETGYRSLIDLALGHRGLTVILSVTALGASLLLLPFIGSEFLPPSDEGEVRVNGKMEVGTKLDLVDRQTKRMERMAQDAVPEMRAWVASVGASGWNPNQAAQGSINLSLSPSAERERSNKRIADDLRDILSGAIPGMDIRVTAPQGQFLLERLLGGDQGLILEIRGFELDIINALAQRAAKAIAKVPGVTDIEVDQDAGVPQQQIRINRNKAADMGLSVRDVTETLETAVAGSRAGEFRAGGNSYRIFAQLKDAEKRSMDEILNLTLTTASGEQAPLRNLVTAEPGRGPLLITRKDQQRVVTVRANIKERDMGSIASDAQQALDQIPRPAGYDILVAGNYQEQQKATRELVISLLMALALVYMVLASLYESLRTPLVVMTSVPLAVVGALLMLFLTDTTFNVQSYIGLIMLGGIVVNNAILLVDQAGQLRESGMNIHDAVVEAGRRRLRPILMTTLTTILALIPLAFGIGEGADAQAPLARVVIGGLLSSTLITLVLIPAVYSLFHPEHNSPPTP
ncbi:MAG: efflux RND transporter permease subunit [Nitrospinota bacterium]|nr:efflux RND transporter permease subunit [Nitrospinota bacterium]